MHGLADVMQQVCHADATTLVLRSVSDDQAPRFFARSFCGRLPPLERRRVFLDDDGVQDRGPSPDCEALAARIRIACERAAFRPVRLIAPPTRVIVLSGSLQSWIDSDGRLGYRTETVGRHLDMRSPSCVVAALRAAVHDASPTGAILLTHDGREDVFALDHVEVAEA